MVQTIAEVAAPDAVCALFVPYYTAETKHLATLWKNMPACVRAAVRAVRLPKAKPSAKAAQRPSTRKRAPVVGRKRAAATASDEDNDGDNGETTESEAGDSDDTTASE